MSSVLTRRRALLGAATLSMTSSLGSLLLPGDALACHTYKGPSGTGCRARKLDRKAGTSSAVSRPQSNISTNAAGSGKPKVSGKTILVRNGPALKNAITNASAGNRILLAKGTYKGSFIVRARGAKGKPILIESQSGNRAVIRSQFKLQGDHIILSRLTFKNAGVDVSGSNCRVTRCILTDTSSAIYLQKAKNAVIDSNEISRWSGRGIDCNPTDGTNVLISRNHLHSPRNNRAPGINIGRQSKHHDIIARAVVEYNLLEGVSKGKSLYCKSSGNTIRYNTLINCQGITNRHGFNNKYIGNYLEKCVSLRVNDKNCQVEQNKLVKCRLGICVMAGTITSNQVSSQGGGYPYSDGCNLIDNDSRRIEIGTAYRWKRTIPATKTVMKGYKGKIIRGKERDTRILSTNQSNAGKRARKLNPKEVGISA